MKGNHLSNTEEVTNLALSNFIKHETFNLTKCLQYVLLVLPITMFIDILGLAYNQHQKCHIENNFVQYVSYLSLQSKLSYLIEQLFNHLLTVILHDFSW
jgi:hypothetical protein